MQKILKVWSVYPVAQPGMSRTTPFSLSMTHAIIQHFDSCLFSVRGPWEIESGLILTLGPEKVDEKGSKLTIICEVIASPAPRVAWLLRAWEASDPSVTC